MAMAGLGVERSCGMSWHVRLRQLRRGDLCAEQSTAGRSWLHCGSLSARDALSFAWLSLLLLRANQRILGW
jgi:hypothetical protein